jgi:hypothetical protein
MFGRSSSYTTGWLGIENRMDELWVAHVKEDKDNGAYEACVCYGTPTPSWGWFDTSKIAIQGFGVKDATIRAQKIAAALNAAEYDPTGIFSLTPAVCPHGYTICAVCKFPAAVTPDAHTP